MPSPIKDETRFRAAQRQLDLSEKAPKMLDALRLIRFALITDYDSSKQRAEKVLALAEAALQGTEDL